MSASAPAPEAGEGRGQIDLAPAAAAQPSTTSTTSTTSEAITRILAWYCAVLAGDNVHSARRRRAIARAVGELAPALGLDVAERECIAAIEGVKRRPTDNPDREWDVWRVFGSSDRVLRLARYARARAEDDARERERRTAARAASTRPPPPGFVPAGDAWCEVERLARACRGEDA